MKLNFKDLKQQKFTIDAEPTDTIGQVKEKVAAEKGWEASSQRLIYSGKILVDANTVESYNIEEKGFIVCMISKPKPAATASKAAAAPPATPAQPASTPAEPAAPAHRAPPAAQAAPATPSPAQPAAATATSPGGSSFNDPSAMLVGNQNEATVREMEAMGFSRPEINRALRAAYFNPDRAIEYLLNGIPAHLQNEQRQNPSGGAQATSPPPAAGATPGATSQTPATEASGDEPVNLFEAAAAAGGRGGARGGNPLAGAREGATAPTEEGQLGAGGQLNMDFLRNSPYFQSLRQLVQQQPAMLEPILQQVAEGNPQLAQMIAQNQEQFLQLLAEDAGEGEGALPPGATQISVTEEERDAIERLCRLGFSRDQVVQAYFACEKNEEMAANFLFEQPDDEDDQPPAAGGGGAGAGH